MKELLFIVRRNLTGRPVKSIAMMILAAVLGGILLAGTVLTKAVQNGFDSLQLRLGADIMVVPYAAVIKKNFDNEFLLGSAWAYDMPGENADKIAQMEGVWKVSTQFFLADEEAEFCAEPIHLMGYDKATDFCVTPWIASSAKKDAKTPGAVIGSKIEAKAGDIISFFNMPLKVIGKMDETGTDFDTSVYVDMETIRALAEASGDETLTDRAQMNDGNAATTVLVDVAEGYDIESVLNDINIHIKKVRALQSKGMVTDEASSMKGTARMIGIMTAVIWVVALAVTCTVSIMMTGERRKEFAVLRVMGASRRKLSGIVLTEGTCLSLTGSLIGIAAALFLIPLSCEMMESALNIPAALPGTGSVALCALLALAASVAAGVLGAALSAGRITRQDAGCALREIG